VAYIIPEEAYINLGYQGVYTNLAHREAYTEPGQLRSKAAAYIKPNLVGEAVLSVGGRLVGRLTAEINGVFPRRDFQQ